jgi:hypothetical protein
MPRLLRLAGHSRAATPTPLGWEDANGTVVTVVVAAAVIAIIGALTSAAAVTAAALLPVAVPSSRPAFALVRGVVGRSQNRFNTLLVSAPAAAALTVPTPPPAGGSRGGVLLPRDAVAAAAGRLSAALGKA